jgi:dihydroorotate dehydrogenase
MKDGIELSNGRVLRYMTASGAMGYYGQGWPWERPLKWFGLLDLMLFAHVMKTIALMPTKGNFRRLMPLDTLRLLWQYGKVVGTVNAIGLTNPGLDSYLEHSSRIEKNNIPLIASIFSNAENYAQELGYMAMKLNYLPFDAIEYNASCPNTKEGVQRNIEQIVAGVDAIWDNCDLPILLKLSVAHGENPEELKYLLERVKGKVQALDINSVPWHMFKPNEKSPLVKYGGGAVSGEIVQPFTWGFAQILKSMTEIPVIAPSVWNFEDLATLRAMGFEAFSFGSVFIPYPWRPTAFVKRDMKERESSE